MPGFFLGNSENVLELDNSDSCATSKIPETTALCTWKDGISNFFSLSAYEPGLVDVKL